MSSDGAVVVELMDALQAILDGDARTRIIQGLTRKGSFGDHLARLRAAMAAQEFRAGEASFDLARPVRKLDLRTRQDGFRVLHAWDHNAHRFTEDPVPVLLLDFFDRARRGATGVPGDDRTLSILLDYSFFHLLTLCAMRAWDTDDPGATLDRLTGILASLQGPAGSGHHFVADAETLLIYALSQFHPEEQAYDRMIERIRTLDERHQVAFARVSAAVLSAHLRWGFWLMYGRDVVRMRDDNVGDYPWLLNSVHTLLRDYVASMEADEPLASRAATGVALVEGLAADPWAFNGRPPPALSDYMAQYGEVRTMLLDHGERLLAELEAFRPRKDRYAPLALHFNFPHNTLVAIVTLALLEGRPQVMPLNALLEEPPDEVEGAESREALARTLMAFSRSSPDRLGYRGAMLVAYDPLSAMRSFSMTVDTLRKSIS